MQWYPLLFEPVYQDRIWGGRALWKVIDRAVPYDHTAESWELSAHPNGMTPVAYGTYQGKTLQELMAIDRVGLLGNINESSFPLLVKVIGAEQDLSVQVHPDDVLAASIGERGKTEVWYVLHAEAGARIIYGLKPNTTREQLAAAVQNGAVLSCLQEVPVRAGDFIPLPAGCVHALGGGILLTEIQQSSDTTYRLYDWERLEPDGRPRPLHKEEGIVAVKPELKLETQLRNGFCDGEILFDDEHFTVQGIHLFGYHTEAEASFCRLWTIVAGSGMVEGEHGPYPLKVGMTVLLPAMMAPVSFSGNLRILQSTPKPC